MRLLILVLAFYSSACAPATDRGHAPLPAPDTTHDVRRFSVVIGWPDGKTPRAPEGFTVTKYADGFRNPRWIYELPNGDILVAEAESEPKNKEDRVDAERSGKARSQNMSASANRISLLRDSDRDGRPDFRSVFLEGVRQPLGMLLLGTTFFVAGTDGVWRYPYAPGTTRLESMGKKILELPAGGYNNHWTRNLLARPDGQKIYVSVGSASNIAEHGLEEEVRRANILEIDPDGSNERIFASGLRNPVGMDWEPETGSLWTVVNERDKLGDELVPDYLTSVLSGGFYGWPFAYFGANEDPRHAGERPDLVRRTIVPDVRLGAHTASLGLAFYRHSAFPDRYRRGAFIGQHGSWNSSELVGYEVVFVPFRNGRPSGPPETFLDGFVSDRDMGEVHGRPVGVTVLADGSLLVADDSSNTLWRVAATSDQAIWGEASPISGAMSSR